MVENTKQKMLFLDDRTKRLHAALEKFSNEYEVTICCNVKECLRLLSREDYDVISLDHDLNGCDFEDPDSANAGMEVVRYIDKCGWPENKKKPLIHVHSSNLFAAHLMVIRLNAMGFYARWNRFEYPERDFSKVTKV
jgi:CheY-like chemotaxis protein